ncbi:MAG: hypothetical protein AMXMBFR57_26900 [Acidimicrobiia bacterium]
MPTHWTYAPFASTDDLEQGDIIAPSPAVKAIFAAVHPHFQHDKYLGFMVATQSCDLVRRATHSKANYISLVAIRPLTQVLHKILGLSLKAVDGEATFKTSEKTEGRRLLERLFNQNEQALGLFFLYPDLDAGIDESAVAFLRVSVAVRSEHCDALREARVGRLTESFQAKLGWLIGNLYVRPATPDWQDATGGEARFRALVNQHLGEARWIDDEIVEQAKAQNVDLATATVDALESLRPPSRLERALTEVRTEILKVAPEFELGLLDKTLNRLRNNGRFRALLK